MKNTHAYARTCTHTRFIDMHTHTHKIIKRNKILSIFPQLMSPKFLSTFSSCNYQLVQTLVSPLSLPGANLRASVTLLY